MSILILKGSKTSMHGCQTILAVVLIYWLMITNIQNLYKIKVSTDEFNKLSRYINAKYGIKLPPEKRVMLQSRLHKRLRLLNMTSFDQYIKYLFSEEGRFKEEIHMMNVVSTNKTEFFREKAHFEFLTNALLPGICEHIKYAERINIWSAGCSSGEEVYTIAMVFEEFFRKNRRYDYNVLGTDISTKVLGEAVDAVYGNFKTTNIPLEYKRNYFMKSRKPGRHLLRIVPELRKQVQFRRLNFMDDSYHMKMRFHLIFCRNVLIYFERDVQEMVINKICEHLKPGGYLFLGHSESITKMDVPLSQVRPTVFQKI